MKIQTIISRMLMLLFVFTIAVTYTGVAQEGHNMKIRIQIEQDQNGEKTTIDRTVNSKEDLLKILEELDLNVQISELNKDENIEVIIRKNKENGSVNIFDLNIDPQFDFHFNFDDEPYLGVRIIDINEENAVEYDLPTHVGCYVTGIVEGTNAENTELKEGDLITAVDGKPVEDTDEFIDAVLEYNPGDVIEISYLRGKIAGTTKATLGKKKMKHHFSFPREEWNSKHDFDFHSFDFDQKMNRGFLGVTVEESENLKPEKGVLIKSIISGSAAETVGLQNGDVILEIEGKDVHDLQSLKSAITSHQKGEEVIIKYKRDKKTNSAKVILGGPVTSAKSSCHVQSNEVVEQIMKDVPKAQELMDRLSADQEELEKIIRESIDMARAASNKVIKEIRINIAVEDLDSDDLTLINNAQNDAKFDNNNDLNVDDLHFFPNPSDGKFRLNFSLIDEGQTTIRIADSRGQLVFFESLGNFKGRFSRIIDLSNEEKGLYFMQVNQNGKTFTKKIVTQ